ncbi:MAG TPA: serine/threonine-protein kinase [Pseudonocardiaceae bacterium]|nr:serine/threonine-protein kinase [Pseudonocardiaceae bacterium]
MPPETTDQRGNDRLIAGRYRLGRVIGRGSMGVVWLAYDEVLHRAVAVKEVRLPPGMPAAEAASVRERTLREARAIAALTHPNVISVFDVARHNGEPYVVMELVASRSLAELIRRHGKCSIEQAALVADSVAAALEAAHRRGITHRDVKPGNVLIGNDGQIKLTDFGIARNMSEVTMTNSGLILGTPAFIAPEAASGDPVTPAADLWGLGATLYAAVTGDPPYDAGDDPVETVTEVVHGAIPKLPEDSPLADVVGALMVKDPTERIGLVEVRRRIRTLLPEPGASVFPMDEPEDADGPADNTPTRGLVSPVARPEAPLPSSSAPAPLAVDPGPLPFMISRSPRRRGRAATVALLAVAVLLFVGAAGGSFVAARTLAGRSLVPPKPSPTSTPPTTPSTGTTPIQLATSTASAVFANGMTGGQFSIDVPIGWQMFTEQRASGEIPSGGAVHYVKPDGTEEVTVQWYPSFYPNNSIENYVQSLRDAWPSADDFNLSAEPMTRIAGLAVGGPEPAEEIGYRTADGSSTDNEASRNAHRTTYADMLPSNDDLWVVSVTVVTDTEGSGNTLFGKIKLTFKPTS